LVTLGVVAVALVVWHRSQRAETCPVTVDFDGVTYTQATTTEEVTSGNELGDGTMSCTARRGSPPHDLPDRFGTVSLDG
jgi:hypothetical protein